MGFMSIAKYQVRTGTYRHYKGGLYFVLLIAETHDHNGDLDVVYLSLGRGKANTRPLRRDNRDADSWLDEIPWPDGVIRTRFVPEFAFQPGELDTLETFWRPKGAPGDAP